jgi:hypothetical protein
MEEEQIKQEVEDQIWELLQKLREIDSNKDSDDVPSTSLYWKKENNKWHFINIGTSGTTFHKTYGIVGGKYKIIGYEFRNSQLVFDYWKKQVLRNKKGYVSSWDGRKIYGRIYAQNEEELLTKIIALESCFFAILTNEGFANLDNNISEKWYFDDEISGYNFHIWTCDKNLLVKRLYEMINILPKGLKVYNTVDLDSYTKKYKKEPKVIFENL